MSPVYFQRAPNIYLKKLVQEKQNKPEQDRINDNE